MIDHGTVDFGLYIGGNVRFCGIPHFDFCIDFYAIFTPALCACVCVCMRMRLRVRVVTIISPYYRF